MNNANHDLLNQLNSWYQQALGIEWALAIKQCLDCKLPKLFGYYMLQLGIDEQQQWLIKSPIRHKCILTSHFEAHSAGVCRYTELPFSDNSIDVVFLPHTLELVVDPEAVLREVYRVLIPEGHLLIAGFNPLSFWGMRQFTRVNHAESPWSGKFSSALRLKRQLTHLGLTIQSVDDFFYRPPIKSTVWLNKCLFLETLGRLVWLYPGGGYLLMATKQAIPVQRIKLTWRHKKRLAAKRFAQPTSYIHHD